MRQLLPFWVPVALLLSSAPLFAQDFGQSWIDRVSHQLIEEEGPLNPRPLEWNFTGGELYTYDSNIFLTHTGRTSDSIFISFLEGNVKTSTTNFDAEADLLVNYNVYVSTPDVSTDEERFFGRMRYQGPEMTLSLAEVFRREVSPTDAVFTTRVPRLISDTSPLVIWKATETVSLEVGSNLEVIDYLRTAFSASDNFNSRTTLTGAYTLLPKGMDLLLQGGYWQVAYTDPASPPNADGFIVRGGIRGELTPKLYTLVLVGYSNADSKDPVTKQDIQAGTPDVEVHLSYTPNPTSTWFADYSRRYGFSADGASFQVVNTADLIGEWNLRDDVLVRARGEYSRVEAAPPTGVRRAYYSLGAAVQYKVLPHVALDSGITYRWGVVPGFASAGDFGDFLFSVGAALLF